MPFTEDAGRLDFQAFCARVDAMTPQQLRAALHFLAGWAPEGAARAVGLAWTPVAVAAPEPVTYCGLGCELPFGHPGQHDDLDGNKWADTPGEPQPQPREDDWCTATLRRGRLRYCDARGPHDTHTAPADREGDPDITWQDEPAASTT